MGAEFNEECLHEIGQRFYKGGASVSFRENWVSVAAEIEQACRRSGREPGNVRVITVTKTLLPEHVSELLRSGMNEFGENRWQQAKPKLERPEARDATWHFIGHLQKNKVKYIVPNFSWVHSIDSLELANAIDDEAVRLGVRIQGMIQVNISGEETKHGVDPRTARQLVKQLQKRQGLVIRGLMTMAPNVADIEETRPVFRGLRELALQISQEVSDEFFTELSMGMSGDFPIAVEEGATMVRIGRRLTEVHSG